MNAPVLEALEARAGASDTDREAWLAERRTGITATEVRDLYLRKITQKQLIDVKLCRVPAMDLSHVPVIAWGNEREPVIAAIIADRYPGIRPESRVFHGENPRHLASPDGLGLYGFDEEVTVSEIKTAGKDIAPWTDAYAEKGYEIQQQWVMWVLGARRSLYAYEFRLDGAQGFVPGALGFEWVHRDDALIVKLVKLADQFLAALDKAAAGSVPEVEPVDELLDTHAVNYLRFLDEEKTAKEAKEREYRAIVAAGKSQTSTLARVTFTPAKDGVELEVPEVDFDAAKEADTALWARKQLAEASLASAEAAWSEHCEGFKKMTTVTGKGSPAKATITAPKQEKGQDA